MSEAATILVIDDDLQIRELTGQLLESNGFKTITASCTAEAEKVLSAGQVDLIVLDLMMPEEDGRQFCQRLRQTSQIPIIMLTALRGDLDLVVGLELGADDYVTKPFTPLALVARIKAVLRRSTLDAKVEKLPDSLFYTFGDYVLDVDRRQLERIDGTYVELTSGEFTLLLTLIENRPRVLSRDQLLNSTVGDTANPFDRSIDTHISRLRKKIEPNPKRAEYIKTVRNLGYAFAAPAEPIRKGRK